MIGVVTPLPAAAIDPRLMRLLSCPQCHSELSVRSEKLSCTSGHTYPIVEGIPVFLLPDKEQTIGIAHDSYLAAQNGVGAPLYVETLGISQDQKNGVRDKYAEGDKHITDPAISYLIQATNGNAYVNRIGKDTPYPIPRIPLESARGELLLDIGCNWGRWSISAARKGWCVVGIDPSLGALAAARRAFREEPNAMFVCGDARFLPFRENSFRRAFSYSVIQHFSEADAEMTLREIGRVLERNGVSKIQMAHQGGLRSRYIMNRRGYLESGKFRVRYWSIRRMKQIFSDAIGPSVLVAEGFGGLGLLIEDWKIVSTKAKILILPSWFMKQLGRVVRPLIRLADSIYVISNKA